MIQWGTRKFTRTKYPRRAKNFIDRNFDVFARLNRRDHTGYPGRAIYLVVIWLYETAHQADMR